MYKVLLVDDEQIIRDGIASLIDWYNHGFLLIGTAQNGIEAYDIILRERPQVVITDLKMPVLDGLGLIAKVKEKYEEVIFIILSGYSEFELAREAMHYGIRYYLLKPCNEQEIIDVLLQVRRYLNQYSPKGVLIAHNENNLTKNKLIRTIIEYVQLNIDNEELSLKWLAKKLVFVNVGYLSKLFIKETGEKFSHYLMRTRMERAINLIEQDADCRICEIARSVGLGDNPQYFSRLFKRFTGYTLSEYKREY